MSFYRHCIYALFPLAVTVLGYSMQPPPRPISHEAKNAELRVLAMVRNSASNPAEVELAVTNNTGKSITALQVEVRRNPAGELANNLTVDFVPSYPSMAYAGPALSMHIGPLKPGMTWVTGLGGADSGGSELPVVAVRTVLFDDVSWAGDGAVARRILAERAGTAAGVRKAMRLVGESCGNVEELRDVLSRIEREADAILQSSAGGIAGASEADGLRTGAYHLRAVLAVSNTDLAGMKSKLRTYFEFMASLEQALVENSMVAENSK